MQVSHGWAWEDSINLLFLHLFTVPQQICQCCCLIPVPACSTPKTNLYFPHQTACLCFYLCFCMTCIWLPGQGSVRVKPSTNHNLSSSISRDLADSVVQMSLGHYHRLSCSSEPEVTTAPSVHKHVEFCPRHVVIGNEQSQLATPNVMWTLHR